MKVIAIALSALLVVPHAFAASKRQPLLRQWLSACSDATNTQTGIIPAKSEVTRQECVERISHEADGVIAGAEYSRGKPWVCVPPDVGARELFAVFHQYANTHPEAISANLGTVVAASLAQAYPCR